MSNETPCGNCGGLTRLDDARYLNDQPLCPACQKAILVGHDCKLSPEDSCEVCDQLSTR